VLPLANSSKQSYGQTDNRRMQFEKGKDLPGPRTMMAVATRRPVKTGSDVLYQELRGQTARSAAAVKADASSVAVTARSRIAAAGDSDFATNSFFHVMGNGRLFRTVNYLASGRTSSGSSRAARLPRVNHKSPDEGDFLHRSDSGFRPARGGGLRGVVEAAMKTGGNPAPNARRLAAPGALIAGIALLEIRNRSRLPEDVAERVHGAEGSRMLLPLPVTEVAGIELGHAGTMHRFERDASGAWFYHGVHAGAQAAHAHQTDTVQAEIIDKAFAALGRTRMERQIKLELQGGAYGLTAPQMIIIVYAKGSPLPLAQYAVGDVAPDGFSRYVLPVGSSYVVTIANYQIDNLLGLIDKMNAPAPRQAGSGGKS
jgi:hypothetical protein